MELRPNVFLPKPLEQKCSIALEIDGNTQINEWHANEAPIRDIKGLDIFDSHMGRIYLDGEAEVAYIPETVALFEDIVNVCTRVKARLEREKALLVSKLPAKPMQYQATKYIVAMYERLKADTDLDKLREFFTFSEGDEKSKNLVEERLKFDPIVLAKQKTTTQTAYRIIVKSSE